MSFTRAVTFFTVHSVVHPRSYGLYCTLCRARICSYRLYCTLCRTPTQLRCGVAYFRLDAAHAGADVTAHGRERHDSGGAERASVLRADHRLDEAATA